MDGMKKQSLAYKFTSINEFTFKNLILSQLWFSPPNLMNDQLEGLVRVKNADFSPSKEAIDNFIEEKRLFDFYWNPRQEIDGQGFLNFYMSHWFRFELNRYGITCFSKKPTESLMWAHY